MVNQVISQARKEHAASNNPISDPLLVSEWNDQRPITEFSASSAQVVDWKCIECNHKWSCRVYSRTHRSQGCPECRKLRQRLEFASNNPITSELLHEEWNHSEPIHLFSASSGTRVGWKCRTCQNEWKCAIAQRKNGTGSGCPKCSKKRGAETLRGKGTNNPITDTKLITEWDDSEPIIKFGKHSQYEAQWKCKICSHIWRKKISSRSAGSKCPECSKPKEIQKPISNSVFVEQWADKELIENHHSNSHYEAKWKCNKCPYTWNQSIKERHQTRIHCPKCSKPKNKDIQPRLPWWTKYPHLLEEWNDERNYKEIVRSDKDPIAWKCSGCSTEEKVLLDTKIRRTKPCAKCEQLQLAKTYPIEDAKLLVEWDDERPIEDFSAKSHESVAWKCQTCSQKWTATIANRAQQKHGCKKCAPIIRGETFSKNRAAQRPIVRERMIYEWHDERPIENFSEYSKKTAKWKCKDCKHIWWAIISNRSNGQNCPNCRPAKISIGVRKNSSERSPISDELLEKEWNESKCKLSDFSRGSNFLAWWKCSTCNHQWQAIIQDRIKSSGCPECAKAKRVISNQKRSGENNPITNQVLIDEWADERPIKDFSIFSVYRGKWKCSGCSTIWIAPIARRSAGHGCPECSKGGFNQTRPGYVYLIINQEEQIGKVGIANSLDARLNFHRLQGFTQVCQTWYCSQGSDALNIETAAKTKIRALNLPRIIGFASGNTEMFFLQDFLSLTGTKAEENLAEFIDQMHEKL